MPDDPDLAALQQALMLGGSGGQPQPPPVPQPDLGSGTAGLPQQAPVLSPAQTSQPGQGPAPSNQPPTPGLTPNFMHLISAMTGKGLGNAPSAPGQPGRPISRSDEFHEFVGNFLNSFAQGMAASGHGPGAFGRGLGASMQAPYQRQLQQYQLGQQQQAQQSQVGLQTAEAERMKAQSQMTTISLPGGQTMQLPASQATEILKTQLQGQAKVDVAGKKRFASSPFGIYDTQTGKFAPASDGGVAATVKMTQEMADSGQFGRDAAQLVGRDVKLSDLSGREKATAAGYGFVQGAEGPAREQKAGPIGSLGLGSPAANQIAQGKLSLAQKTFERDTFGTLFGKNIPSSLIDDGGTTIGWKSPSAPTSSIKTQGQMAKGVLPIIDEATRQLASANKAGKLGPGAGRLNEFLVGTVGADDPQFAALRAITSLAMSGTLKLHFGARGGQQMFDHFVELVNTGKMTYGDLAAALKSFRFVVNNYSQEVKTAGGKSDPLGIR